MNYKHQMTDRPITDRPMAVPPVNPKYIHHRRNIKRPDRYGHNVCEKITIPDSRYNNLNYTATAYNKECKVPGALAQSMPMLKGAEPIEECHCCADDTAHVTATPDQQTISFEVQPSERPVHFYTVMDTQLVEPISTSEERYYDELLRTVDKDVAVSTISSSPNGIYDECMDIEEWVKEQEADLEANLDFLSLQTPTQSTEATLESMELTSSPIKVNNYKKPVVPAPRKGGFHLTNINSSTREISLFSEKDNSQILPGDQCISVVDTELKSINSFVDSQSCVNNKLLKAVPSDVNLHSHTSDSLKGDGGDDCSTSRSGNLFIEESQTKDGLDTCSTQSELNITVPNKDLMNCDKENISQPKDLFSEEPKAEDSHMKCFKQKDKSINFLYKDIRYYDNDSTPQPQDLFIEEPQAESVCIKCIVKSDNNDHHPNSSKKENAVKSAKLEASVIGSPKPGTNLTITPPSDVNSSKGANNKLIISRPTKIVSDRPAPVLLAGIRPTSCLKPQISVNRIFSDPVIEAVLHPISTTKPKVTFAIDNEAALVHRPVPYVYNSTELDIVEKPITDELEDGEIPPETCTKELRVVLPRMSEQTSPPTNDIPRQWVTAENQSRILDNTKKRSTPGPLGEAYECALCNFYGSKKRVRVHVKQHFYLYFCACGRMGHSRDGIYEHQRLCLEKGRIGHGSSPGDIYEVDLDNYPSFIQALGLKALMPHPIPMPIVTGHAQRHQHNKSQPRQRKKTGLPKRTTTKSTTSTELRVTIPSGDANRKVRAAPPLSELLPRAVPKRLMDIVIPDSVINKKNRDSRPPLRELSTSLANSTPAPEPSSFPTIDEQLALSRSRVSKFIRDEAKRLESLAEEMYATTPTTTNLPTTDALRLEKEAAKYRQITWTIRQD